MLRSLNRKLLVSVYDAQEAREAVLGGGRIIDSEDPKSALGNISPLRIMAISEAVLDYQRDFEVQLSTNIGEDQLIFRRTSSGRAVEKSPQEMAGKAAQAALGVALSMGTAVHPCPIVKVGLDGMPSDQLLNVLTEVVRTLQHTRDLKQCSVMSVLFAQDLAAWDVRKLHRKVREELVSLREFSPAFGIRGEEGDRFHLIDFWESLRTDEGKKLDPKSKDPAANLRYLKEKGVLPEEVADDLVILNELYPHNFAGIAPARRTTIEVIRKMVDLTAEAGANAMMLDTSILSKVSNICLVDTSDEDMAHLSPFLVKNGFPQKGILKLSELKFFVDYCHYRGIVPNLAGSIDSIQAQQVWVRLPKLDQLSTRSAGSAVVVEPGTDPALAAHKDTRQLRTIVRELVSGLAPPEHGGELNLPVALQQNQEAKPQIDKLLTDLQRYRAQQGLPRLQAYYFTSQGERQAIELDRVSEPPTSAPPPPSSDDQASPVPTH